MPHQETRSPNPGERDLYIAGEYKRNYIIVQKEILQDLPDDDARLKWIERYGRTFHDLAADNGKFHELLTAEKPDLKQIRGLVERTADAERQERDLLH